MQNRVDDAWHVVEKLHGSHSNVEAETFAKEEFYQMRCQVAADQTMASGETVWTLFTKPSYRKRMICAFLTMFGAESTGILVVYSKFLQLANKQS
jgi:hypothetical protein